jgi:hypothetical protein
MEGVVAGEEGTAAAAAAAAVAAGQGIMVGTDMRRRRGSLPIHHDRAGNRVSKAFLGRRSRGKEEEGQQEE